MGIQQQAVAAPTPRELRQAFSAFPTGVVAVCGLVDGAPVGMAVNSFSSTSLEPPLVAISVARTSATWPRLAGRRLGLSVLSVGQDAVCRRLAAREGDRVDGTPWHASADGAVFIADAALWLDCAVRSVYDGGDHEIVVLSVLGVDAFPDVDPLVFHQSRFHVIQGAS